MINTKMRCLMTASAATLAAAVLAAPAGATTLHPDILVRDDVGLGASVDADDTWSPVVQIFRLNNTTGGIFFNCTGTLINPRTVLTAAHCVNSASSESYGTVFGGQDSAMLVATGVDTFERIITFANTGAPYAFGGVAASSDVIIHPSANLDNGGLPFPWADVAMIALDEPITDVGTMPILLSPLDALTHVVVTGYGTVGTGETGQQYIDFFRLEGENELGMIGSPADLLDGIFPGYAPTAVTLGAETQPYYWFDFDDPDRTPEDLAGCDFTGFNISCTDLEAVKAIDWFDGDALPNEAGTAPGDSGGPLIADQIADFPIILGVLSGGYDFFGLNGLYSDISFYNPLFPFHEFITANSPYKYVSAKAGNGDWLDPDHWTQDLDPNFYVFDENGELVNGVPGGSEEGVYETEPKVGSILGNDISDNDTTPSPYLPPRDGGETVGENGQLAGDAAGADGEYVASPTTATRSPSPADGQVATVGGAVAEGATASIDDAVRSPMPATGQVASVTADIGGYPTSPVSEDVPGFGTNIPDSSALIGPGSTGFVPDNTDGTPGVAFSNPAQYFDVTLMAEGTTTLSEAFIEIDKLTLMGGGAGLVIQDAVLDVLIDTQLLMGSLIVGADSVLYTPRLFNDFGILGGTGVVFTYTPDFDFGDVVNRGGMIAPGDAEGEIGTLTLDSNFIQMGQGVYMVDIAGGDADMLEVLGAATLGGTLAVNVSGDSLVRGDSFTVLTADGGITGTFGNLATQFTPVLGMSALYSEEAVSLEVTAADYYDVIGVGTPSALYLAAALDAATSPDALPSGAFGEVIGTLDALPSAEALTMALHTMNPSDTFIFDTAALQTSRQLGMTIGDRARRASLMDSGTIDWSGLSIRQAGQRLFAQAAPAQPTATDAAPEGAEPSSKWAGMSAFVAGDLVFGDYHGADEVTGVDTSMITAGVDKKIGKYAVIGLAATAAWYDSDSEYASFGGETYGISGYAGASNGALYANAVFGYLDHEFDSTRPIILGGDILSASGAPEASQFYLQAEMGWWKKVNDSVTVGPLARFSHSDFDLDGYTESGADGFGAILTDRQNDQSVLSIGGASTVALGMIPDTQLFGELTWNMLVDGDAAYMTEAALVAAPSVAFGVPGPVIDDNFGGLRIGFNSKLADGVSLQGMISTDIRRAQGHTSSGTVSLAFGF